MALFTKRMKKWSAFSFIALTITILSIPTLRAQTTSGGETYLQQIAENTYNTLVEVNDLPTYMSALWKLAHQWIDPDATTTTATIQGNFANYSNQALQSVNTQNGLQQKLITDYFGTTITSTTVPYANDLTFQTLLGMPPFAKDPRQTTGGGRAIDSPYNYIKNAGGLSLSHTPPSGAWKGTTAAQQRYVNYFGTITAIATFNAYIVSQLYGDNANKGQLTQTQTSLIQQASSSDWFTQVASEKIGVVLRQILMYDSQLYVLMTESLQTQKQMLATQAMGNTLLMLLNQQNEQLAVKQATGEVKS